MKKSLKIASWIAGAFILVIVAVFLILAALLLDPQPAVSPQEITPADVQLQNRIIGQIMRNFSQRPVPETAVLKLTPAEFQSLVRCADAALRNQAIPLRNYQPELEKEFFKLTVPYDTGQHWLFGGWIIGRFRLQVTKKGEQLDVTVLNAEIGKFKLSNNKAQEILDGQLEKLKKHPDYKRFDRMIEEISIDKDGSLIISYRPRGMISLIM